MNEVHTSARQLRLEPNDAQRLATLCGPLDQHLRQIEASLAIEISNRGNVFHLSGSPDAVAHADRLLNQLYLETDGGQDLSAETVRLRTQHPGESCPPSEDEHLRLPRCLIRPHGRNQRQYLQRIRSHDISFGIGPAGTGKSWLAVACAVDALHREQVNRIVLVRPAVEAGEKLGFLPGDLQEKVNPYLRPLYDALFTMLGTEQVGKLVERNVIEIAPLAYMRGRTLDDAFIILDEGQNTTTDQMKMFLTRLGFASRAVVTGDVTQIDLARGQESGLLHACKVLHGVPGVSFTHFNANDVVRHPLVQHIVEAYDRHERIQQPQEDS